MIKSSFLKKFFYPLKINFFSLILFELIYKALGTFIIFPLLLQILRNLITNFNTSLITTDNIRLIYQSPLNLLVLITLGIVFLYYLLLEITIICTGLKFGINNKRVSFFELLKTGFLRSLSYFSIANWLAFVFIVVFIPIIHIGLKSGISEILYLRLYLGYYFGITISNATFIITAIVEFVLLIFLTNIFVFFTNSDITIPQALYLNFQVFKDHFFKTTGEILRVLLISLVILLALFILFLSVGVLVYLTVVLLNNSTGSTESYRLFVNIISPLSVGYVALVAVFLPLLFYSGIYGTGFEIRKETIRSQKRLGKVAILMVLFLVYSVFEGSVVAANISEDAIVIAQTGAIITAHRGNSNIGYENTLPAFESAIQNGSEYVEFDLQKTLDGILVVSHSPQFLTRDGMTKFAEHTYSELKDKEIINYYTKEPTGQSILTFEELLDFCKDKVKLNIELKTINNDDDLIEQVTTAIKNRGMENQCYIASGNYQYVLATEESYPELNTLFLTSSNYGDIENLTFDSLSLEQEAIDQETVDRLHLRGKMIQAWTLENEEQIKKMLDTDVDYLIVNDVRMAQNILAQNRPDRLEQLLELIGLVLVRI